MLKVFEKRMGRRAKRLTRGKRSREAAAQIHDASSVYFATPTVARHQLYVMLDRIVANENERSLIRARQRGNMRRFVLDVHQIWLTNLDHLEDGNVGRRLRHARIDTRAIADVCLGTQNTTQASMHTSAGPA